MNKCGPASIFALALAILLSGCGERAKPICRNDAPGFLINNVQILDGSGAPAVAGAVRVTNGVISGVGDLQPCDGESVVNGGGRTLAPGFIDTHSHADSDLLEFPDALPVISQGITTIIAGQDGGSHYPLADFYAAVEANPATVNIASYSGHNTLRIEAMGEDFKRVATDEEIAAMSGMLSDDLAAGALGLAAGLEYEPGIHSSTEEVIALAKVAAAEGGRYISHVRSEDRWFEDAIDEIILIGRETGMPVQVSHIKLAMKRLWGSSEDVIAKLDAARAEGINITADIYPYEYWQSTIMVLLPDRDPTNLEVITEVLDQIAPPDGLWMTRFEPNPDYVGKTLTEIAELREVDAVTAFSEIAQEALAWEAETGQRAESIIGTSMTQSDISDLMAWPYTNICTDGGIVNLHPRSTGSFPRVLGYYSREQGVLSLPEAVRKMTGLAAENMGIYDRGRIRKGLVADLTLFEPDTVIDRSTPQEPKLLSEGITSVWVGGELVYAAGQATTARPGKVIRRPAQPDY